MTPFEVLPEGFGARLRVSTELPASRGFRGRTERRLVPNVLANLDHDARQQADQILSLRRRASA